jgi:shikimate kinase
VTANRTIRNLALIGFMGSGKSSVGRTVAETLDYAFLDTDDLIEQKAGMSISEIFEREGEPAFRGREAALVGELTCLERCVISTGGGLPTLQGNLDSLKSHALVVCLWTTPERILERVQSQSHRPLLQVPDPLARIEELLDARRPFYRQADVLVSTDRRSVREVAQQVVTQFRLAQKS